MDPKEANDLHAFATFLGYEEFALQHPFMWQDAAVEKIKIKQLPVRKFPEMATCLANKDYAEPLLVELFTDLSGAQVDMLHPSDNAKIFARGMELNRDPFTAWARRQVARALEHAQKLFPDANGATSSPQ